MGYLNNSVVTVDAILTNKGRELLARGDGSFRITQFALSDDEIDYTLYNPTHPSGSAFYGQAIENMPLLEAFPETTQNLRYKLEQRLQLLEQAMKRNMHISDRNTVDILIDRLTYAWNVLNEEDKDFIQGCQFALEEQIEWNKNVSTTEK